MDSKKISVIIPVYNVERFLSKCLDSVINQSYPNLEIILIDDGSSDDSPRICDLYAKKDKRFNVFHKNNGGISETRNYGLDRATGDYIMFVDSDDYIHEDMCSIMLKNASETIADMVLCNYYIDDSNGNVIIPDNILKTELITPDIYIHQFITERNICYVSPCFKLYKKFIFDSLRYPVGYIHEDEFAMHKIVYQCSKISSISDRLYYYVQSDHSIMRSKFSAKRMDAAYAILDQYHFSKKIGNQEFRDFSVQRLSSLISEYQQHLDDPECEERYYDLIKKVRFLFYEKQAWSNVSWRGRLYYRLGIIFPHAMNLLYTYYSKRK